jgi:phosphoribosylaminoimidazolecarboxamide formyltransferase/IMP cyclohydrolase
MQKKIQSALISVFYKDGLEPIVKELDRQKITIYSTGGTQQFIENLGIACVPVESLTSYPSILGGRVKTLHPAVFGGILGRRDVLQDIDEMKQYNIPEIDLVIVDLYPFEETVRTTTDEKSIIEKIDIGGPSMIRAAAKNFKDIVVIADRGDYEKLEALLHNNVGYSSLDERKAFAAKAFEVVMNYDIAISNYFNRDAPNNTNVKQPLRYGENPHQKAVFYGNLSEVFEQLHGKELSYNNIVDVDAAIQLINDFPNELTNTEEGGDICTFAIIKHTNVCGIAQRATVKESWDAALAGDPESAFGGVLVCNCTIDKTTAEAINSLFFEVLIAPAFSGEALTILKSKKNRILLQMHRMPKLKREQYKSLLNGMLLQDMDEGNYNEWN